jgi:AraC-like DNA-binding protein
MISTTDILMVPISYSRIIARELKLQKRDLDSLLRGTGLNQNILLTGDETHISTEQQMRVLENAQHIMGTADFGLRLGHCLQPSSHGPMGYMALSSPDVITALEAFADFLPTRLPFSAVTISTDAEWINCLLELKVDAKAEVRRILQECFALIVQSLVESVVGYELIDAQIELAHRKPDHYQKYTDYLHAPVHFSRPANVFRVPVSIARQPNASGHSKSYAIARNLCQSLLETMPATAISTSARVERLLLSSPMGSLNIGDVAQAMLVTKRTLQRRLEQETTSYRQISEKLQAALADRHLRESSITIETLALLLGYNDTAAFRKAFHRWYGQSPSHYRSQLKRQD